MTVNEWIKKEKLRLAEFKRMWERERCRRPKVYPNSLDEADWSDQYTTWMYTRRIRSKRCQS